ncbi:MAG: hypothetical protein VX409_02865 [Verrucomicrobiota bacterium]|nr:hypothetical protein [Verrucomicrobiota bacterium]
MSYLRSHQLAAFTIDTSSQIQAITAAIKASVVEKVKEGAVFVKIDNYNAKFSPTSILDYPDKSIGKKLVAKTPDQYYEVIGKGEGSGSNYLRVNDPKNSNNSGFLLADKQVVRVDPQGALQRMLNGKWVNYKITPFAVGQSNPPAINATISSYFNLLLFGGSATQMVGENTNGTVNDWLGMSLNQHGQLSLVQNNPKKIGEIEVFGNKSNLIDWRGQEGQAATNIIDQTKNWMAVAQSGAYSWLRKMGVTFK